MPTDTLEAAYGRIFGSIEPQTPDQVPLSGLQPVPTWTGLPIMSGVGQPPARTIRPGGQMLDQRTMAQREGMIAVAKAIQNRRREEGREFAKPLYDPNIPLLFQPTAVSPASMGGRIQSAAEMRLEDRRREHPEMPDLRRTVWDFIGEQYNVDPRAPISLPPAETWRQMGPITAGQRWAGTDISIGFDPRPLTKLSLVYAATKRISFAGDMDYINRPEDVTVVENFLLNAYYEEVRGSTFGAKVTGGLMAMPGWMGDFIATGGVALLGRKAGKKAAGYVLRRYVNTKIGSLLARGAGWVAAGAVRTAAMPHRLGAAYLEQSLPDGYDVGPDGSIAIRDTDTTPATAFFKAFGTVMIEAMSEEAGGGMGRLMRKFPGLRRIFIPAARKIRTVMPKAYSTWIGKGISKAGYNNYISELGEEELEKVLKAVTGIAPEHKGMDFFERVMGILDMEEMYVSAAVLAVPGAIRGAASLISAREQRIAAPFDVEQLAADVAAAKTTDAVEGPTPDGAFRQWTEEQGFSWDFLQDTADGKAVLKGLARQYRDSQEVPSEKSIQAAVEDPAVASWELQDQWIANTDEAVAEAKIDQKKWADRLLEIAGGDRKLAERYNRAIAIWSEMKDTPGYESLVGEQVTAEDRATIALAQALPQEAQDLGVVMEQARAESGRAGLEGGVIKTLRDNYIAHLWVQKRRPDQTAAFQPDTARAKRRTLPTILDGWNKGLVLAVPGAIEATTVARLQVAQAIQDRNLIKLSKAEGLMADNQVNDDWVELQHPNFRSWQYAGYDVEGEVYGKNLFVDQETGRLFESRRLWAHPDLGKRLNHILEPGWQSKTARTILKYNAILKAIRLLSSFFHHQAYLRSYLLGAYGVNVTRPIHAARVGYAAGKEAAYNFGPQLRLLVRNGLTFELNQDWAQELVNESTIIGKTIDKLPVEKQLKNGLIRIRDWNTNVLFHKLGPFLKVQAAILEFNSLLRRHEQEIRDGKLTIDQVAKWAAELLNKDFGGLHHRRMGRSEWWQSLFRLFFLAPDWTESNVLSMLGVLKKGGEGAMYRRFWMRVFMRGMGATQIFNVMMSFFDDETLWKRYQLAWEEGNLRWLDVDITPIYKAVGGQSGERKYFSLIGHFRDPIKFMSSPLRSAVHKGSVFTSIALNAITGTDWSDRPFTDVEEFWSGMGGRVMAGPGGNVRLGGTDRFRTVKPWRGSEGPVTYDNLLSFLIYQGRSAAPIQVQQAMGFMQGEIAGFDAITKSLGMMTSTTYPKKKTFSLKDYQ